MNTVIYSSPFVNTKEIFTITLFTDCSITIRKSSDGNFQLTASNLALPCRTKIVIDPKDDPQKAPLGVLEITHIGESPEDKGEHLGRIDGRTTVSAGRYDFDVFGNPANLLDNGEYLSYEVYLERFDENGRNGFDIYIKHTLTTPAV